MCIRITWNKQSRKCKCWNSIHYTFFFLNKSSEILIITGIKPVLYFCSLWPLVAFSVFGYPFRQLTVSIINQFVHCCFSPLIAPSVFSSMVAFSFLYWTLSYFISCASFFSPFQFSKNEEIPKIIMENILSILWETPLLLC